MLDLVTHQVVTISMSNGRTAASVWLLDPM